MLRKIVRSISLLVMVGGALMIAVPAMAYVDTSPGSGGTTSTTNPQPGQPFTFTARFTDLAPGTIVSFSASCAGTTFSPASAALDATSSASTTVTIPSACAGQSVTITATGPQGQTVSATVTVAGGFPNTTAVQQSVPVGWAVIAVGLLLLLGGTFGLARRTRSSSSAQARA